MTLEQIRAMSDDEIIRAIAPLQGFSVVSEANRRKEYHFSADERDRIYGFIVDSRGRRKGKIKPIPAWATDLNAAMTLVPSRRHETFAEAKIEAPVDADIKQFFFAIENVCHAWIGDEPVKEEQTSAESLGAGFAWWFVLCANQPRALCEAFLLWKGSAT